jgi:indolepyruvate ferredoxin oxidoreductase beta subunit
MNNSDIQSIKQDKINFLLVGVGGQGTILASNILSELGMKLGFDVKKAEVHGMSQRGGSVISHVRWGAKVFSPIIEKATGDVMVAFEKMEAIRYIDILKPGGIVLVNDHSIMPITVSSGYSTYPEENILRTNLEKTTSNVHWVDGSHIAEDVGNIKTANVVILGALSGLLDMEIEPWLEVIEARVPPKFIDINRQAFIAGRKKMAVVE